MSALIFLAKLDLAILALILAAVLCCLGGVYIEMMRGDDDYPDAGDDEREQLYDQATDDPDILAWESEMAGRRWWA